MTNPFAAVNLNGDGTMRGATLALPADVVRNLIPAGLELGPQDVTRAGTHPVIVFFHDMFRAISSVPTIYPSLTYYEQGLAVPFFYLSGQSITPGYPGPYYFVRGLLLDNMIAILGGVIGWGLPKQPASIE